MPEFPYPSWRTSARRGTLSVTLWAFGLATTLLLVGLWGRAVTHDEPTVQASARSVVDAEIAADRIYSWIEDGVAASTEIDDGVAAQVVSELRQRPEVQNAIDGVIDQFIAALFAPEGESVTIDLAAPLEPVVPIAAASLAERDATFDEAELAAALDNADAIDLAAGEAASVARVVDDARSVLSVVVVLALVALLATGSIAIWLADDHLAMVRTLAVRILLSAVSFAVLFRVGSWVLDPRGGGSPVAGGGSILLGSNAGVFLTVAAGAMAVIVGVGWSIARRRRSVVDSVEGTREFISV